MPSTHFIEETPHRLVRIDQYFRWLDSTIHERLKGLQATPQHIALDGWLAAVKAAQLVAGSTWTSADKRRIREDRVREILLSKEIEPEELDIELIMRPTYELYFPAQSENFDQFISHYWFELCRSQNRHGPIDHLEFDWDYRPTPDSTARKCRVQLRRPQSFPLRAPNTSTFDNPFAGLDPFFASLQTELHHQTIPQIAVFFSSRLEYLRHLSHQAEVFKKNKKDLEYNLVRKRTYNVVLQMTLYHRSVSCEIRSVEDKLGDKISDWTYMIEVATFFGNETFGKFGFKQNRRFLEEKKGKFEEVWEGAAEWWCSDSTEDRQKLLKALQEMGEWITSGFEELDEQLQTRGERNARQASTARAVTLWNPHSNPFSPLPRYPL